VEKSQSSESTELKDLIDQYSPYLTEIRKRLLMVFFVFVLAWFVGFVFYEPIIKALISIFSLEGVNIVFTSPFQFINLAISCGIALGLVVVFPLLLYQLLSFLKPALKVKELRLIMSFLPFSLVLFLVGFGFGVLVMRWQIELFLHQANSLGINNVLDISRLLQTIVLTSVFMGIGFQFPLIILALLRLGVLSPKQLSRQRLWIYLGALLFAILLPIDSILADLIISLPLIILFELTLFLNFFFERRRAIVHA
jgi:sec-independent protein translocase protein TatC